MKLEYVEQDFVSKTKARQGASVSNAGRRQESQPAWARTGGAAAMLKEGGGSGLCQADTLHRSDL